MQTETIDGRKFKVTFRDDDGRTGLISIDDGHWYVFTPADGLRRFRGLLEGAN